ncbi:91_t:CDS:2 [Paraglomus occultum]|uniref:91_t:CDS:1 n=1 Tax=Paraglomus occultum TaxID=144539 RepID=A0A9N8ZBV1_9GLOM|nr:91_t:CDS:2 [Paraglomus occultum]
MIVKVLNTDCHNLYANALNVLPGVPTKMPPKKRLASDSGTASTAASDRHFGIEVFFLEKIVSTKLRYKNTKVGGKFQLKKEWV